MEFTANQIASFIQGKVEGDENATVNTFAKIEEGKPGHWGGIDTNKGLNPLSSTNFKRLNYE